MSCTHPLLALDLGLDNSTGKHRIKFLSRSKFNTYQEYKDFYGDNLLLLPCGTCASCRFDSRRVWSIRCALEAKSHQDNCFLTLTYDAAHIVDFNKHDLIDFIKKLRNKGLKVRYFGCYEKGELTDRDHFHVCLFGYFPDDAKRLKKSYSGDLLYSSKFLSEIWSKGMVFVGDFTSNAAGYVSGYINKKKGKKNCLYFSRKPGIGFDYFVSHKYDLIGNKKIVVNGCTFNVPRYYMKKLEEVFNVEELKKQRKTVGVSFTSSVLASTGFDYDHYLVHLDELRKEKSKTFKKHD